MNMSFAITTPQCRAYLKNVTRRVGWDQLKAGDTIQQVVKGMGLKKGEKVEPIHKILIRQVRKEPLQRMTDDPGYGAAEVIREGFPDMTPAQFVLMFCDTHKGVTPSTLVNRIAFRYWVPADHVITIPARVAVCPGCRGILQICPDGWTEAGDHLICDSFLSWCENEPDSDDPKFESMMFDFDQGHKISPLDWFPLMDEINDWVRNTFVFELDA